MRELGRILSSRRLLAGLALILLLNGLLYTYEQSENDFGLDLALPGGGLLVLDGEFTSAQEPVDAWAAYQRYSQWLRRAQNLPLPDAVELLNGEKTALTERITGGSGTEDDRLDYVAVNNLLKRTDYLTGYGDWLEGIQRNRDNLLSFSIFNDPDSFSGRNIVKTAGEFERLHGVEPALGADGAVETFMTFRITDYFLLLALLLTAMSFLEERKAGLWSVVHASPRGRARLALRRTLIILGASVFGVILLYGTDLALGFSIYGGLDGLGRPVQSVEALGKLPMLTTVGGFLVRFLLLRIAAAFLTGLLLWILLAAVNNVKYAVIVAAGALAAEYGLYTLLPVQSAFNILKYFNIFTYISLGDLYTNYLNIDLFGFPLGIRSISGLALIPLCPLLAAACVLVHCRKKPAGGRDLLGRAAYLINAAADRLLRRARLFGMELHKTMWIQKGIVVAALLVYVSSGLSYTAPVPVTSQVEQASLRYTLELAGPVTDATFALMDAERESLEAVKTAFEDAKAAFDRGSIDYPELDRRSREAALAQIKLDGLAQTRARCEELLDRGRREGFTPWLMDETPFESVYGPRAGANQHRAALTALLALALLLAGCMSYERRSGMTILLRSTPRGRGGLLLRKLLAAASVTTFVWAAVYGMEVYTLLTEFTFPAHAAAKNLTMLAEFPLNISIAAALSLLYAARWLILLCAAMVVLFISSLFRRTEASCVACVSALLPSVLYAYISIEPFRPLSVILPLELTPLLTPANGALSPLLLPAAALITAAAISTVCLFSSKIQ